MIKWSKKLVKGSDFVATKKKISVIALDPRAGKSYGEDIAGLFSDVVDISVFSMLDGSAAAKQKENELWAYLKAHTSAGVYRSIRYGFGGVTNLKIPKGDKLVLGGYRIAQKIFKFN